jgi:hypothetical protein
MLAGMMEQFGISPALTSDFSTWAVRFEQLDAVRKNAHSSNLAFQFNTTPLGQLLELKHLVIKDDAFASRRIDDVSNQLMCNHNIWVYLDASQRANQIAFGSQRSNLPSQILDALHVIETAFKVDDWQAYIDANKWALDVVAPVRN